MEELRLDIMYTRVWVALAVDALLLMGVIIIIIIATICVR